MSKGTKVSIVVRFDGSVLRPADAFAQEQLDGLPRNTDLSIEPKLVTGSGQRRLYWAGLGLLAQNIEDDRWPTSRHLSNMLLTTLGYVDIAWRMDGSYYLTPNSLAVDNMEEPEFLAYFERARAEVVKRFEWDPWEAWKDEKDAEKANRQQGSRR